MISVTMSGVVASDHDRAAGLYREGLRVIKRLHIPVGQSRLLTIGAGSDGAAIRLVDHVRTAHRRALGGESGVPAGQAGQPPTRGIGVVFMWMPTEPLLPSWQWSEQAA